MRIRTIKPEWLDDERTACASPEARVMSVALILMADDHGRGRASVAMLGGRIFPGSANPREDAAKAREELVSARYVLVYEVDGQEYYQIRNWAKHQRVDRPSASQLPPPPSDQEQKPLCCEPTANIREDAPNPRVVLATDLDLDRGPGGDHGGEGNAGEPATPAPSKPTRRRDVHDYHGAQATAAQVALGAALQAAGGTPRPRGGFPQQTAWAQVACDAHELAESLGRPVAEVLALSATGFVATRGIQAQATWWAEDFGRYYEAGRKGAPRKAGSMTPLPKLEDYKPTTDEELDAMFGPEVSA